MRTHRSKITENLCGRFLSADGRGRTDVGKSTTDIQNHTNSPAACEDRHTAVILRKRQPRCPSGGLEVAQGMKACLSRNEHRSGQVPGVGVRCPGSPPGPCASLHSWLMHHLPLGSSFSTPINSQKDQVSRSCLADCVRLALPAAQPKAHRGRTSGTKDPHPLQ